jgi:hypothetical protein
MALYWIEGHSTHRRCSPSGEMGDGRCMGLLPGNRCSRKYRVWACLSFPDKLDTDFCCNLSRWVSCFQRYVASTASFFDFVLSLILIYSDNRRGGVHLMLTPYVFWGQLLGHGCIIIAYNTPNYLTSIDHYREFGSTCMVHRPLILKQRDLRHFYSDNLLSSHGTYSYGRLPIICTCLILPINIHASTNVERLEEWWVQP